MLWVLSVALWVLPAALCLLFGVAGAHASTATTTTLTVSGTSITQGTMLTLNATVTAGGSAATPGTVRFCDTSVGACRDSAIVGQAQLTANGHAIYKFAPSLSNHTYKAIFSGTTTYTASTSATSSTVAVTGKYTSLTAVAASGSAGAYTLTATVTTQGSPSIAPTGTVTFQDASNGNYSLGTATLGASTVSQPTVTSWGSAASVPRYTATGDFNGDGIPDLAVTLQNASKVAIYLGVGDGTYTAASGSPRQLTNTAVGVVAADFNNDGKVDLAVSNYGSGTISILLGNGDGTFQTPTSVSVASNPEFIAFGDMNNDGNLDLIVCQQSGGTLTVLYGDGSGGFPSSSSITVGSQPYGLAIADFNHDGNLDIAAANYGASTISIFIGDGSTTFTQASGSPITVGSNPLTIAAGDLNGDGYPDLVVGNGGANSLSILLGAGDGTFTAGTSLTTTGSAQKYVALGDMNGDGKLDIVLSESTGKVSGYNGNGDGTFQTPSISAFSGATFVSLTLLDADGDGLPDVAISNAAQSFVAVGLNKLNHTATAVITSVSVPGSGTHNVTAAYLGDSYNTSSTSSTLGVTGTKTATSLVLNAAPGSSGYGQQVALSATLSPWNVGNETSNGDAVTFMSGGTSLGTANLTSGSATLNVTSLAAGTDSLTAVFAADANFLGSTSAPISYVVGKSTPSLSWAAPSSISYGTALSSTQLNASSGGVAGTYTYTPAAGTVLNVGASQTLAVSFTPTDAADYNGAAANTTITVTQAAGTILLSASSNPVPFGTALTLGASLPGGASGTVTFSEGATVLGTGPIASGAASYTTSSLAVGTHTLTASWPGNGNYTAGTSSMLSVTVAKASVTLSKTSSLNPSVFGDTVTFTFQASGGSVVPTGTLTLKDGSTTLSTITLNGAGIATYVLSTLAAGTHAVQAIYNGDGNYI